MHSIFFLVFLGEGMGWWLGGWEYSLDVDMIWMLIVAMLKFIHPCCLGNKVIN
jgi:hypothetical protein